jgi:phytoene synthase
MRDRDLVRLHWPVALRPAFDALFEIDDALGEVVASATQPALGAIKLAWWREQLQGLDGSSPPAEPRLQAAYRELLPLGVSGAELAELENGWLKLVEREDPGSSVLAAEQRGPRLFLLGARLLAPANADDLTDAGREFAAADLARRGFFEIAPRPLLPGRDRCRRELRPLTALWALARRDHRRGGPPFEPEATPGRSWTLLRHRLTGAV